MKIKVCGLTNNESGRTISQLPEVTHLGFIFYEKSPRFTTTTCKTSKAKIGVFVNAEISRIIELVTEHELSGVQLHGTESPEFIAQLPENLVKIKAFGISAIDDLKQTDQFEGLVDYFLFDTKTKDYGGSGKQFDWKILEHYHGKTPFFLSGGIGLDSVSEIELFRHEKLAGFDLNSRFERNPKDKNVSQLQHFIKTIV